MKEQGHLESGWQAKEMRWSRRAGGFTLVELLVVIAVIAILAAMLLPALAKSKTKAQSLNCLHNLKQLQNCFHLYATDYLDRLPPNNSVSAFNGAGGGNTILANGVSWCPDNPRTDTTISNLADGVLFQYNTAAAIYHCPSDRATLDNSQQLRFRSYNMSQSVNGFPEFLNANNFPVNIIPCYKKFTQIAAPSPSDLMVFIDESPDTMVDAQFGNPVGMPYWPAMWFDMPSDRHNQGGCLSFADGHVERWKWKTPKVFQFMGQQPSADEMADYNRIQAAMRMYSPNEPAF